MRGTLFTVQKALPLLNDGASVEVDASTAADRGGDASGTYATSKAAVRSFVRTWANQLKSRGHPGERRLPGSTDTPGIDGLVGAQNAAATKANLAAAVPLGGWVAPRKLPRS